MIFTIFINIIFFNKNIFYINYEIYIFFIISINIILLLDLFPFYVKLEKNIINI